jgi:hypothetical protein
MSKRLANHILWSLALSFLLSHVIPMIFKCFNKSRSTTYLSKMVPLLLIALNAGNHLNKLSIEPDQAYPHKRW